MSPDARVGVPNQEQVFGNSSGNPREIQENPFSALSEIFPMEFSEDQAAAASILENMGMEKEEMINAFKTFEWQEGGASSLRNLLGEIREGEFESLWKSVHEDPEKLARYEVFYERFQEWKLLDRLSKGASLSEAADEADIDIERAEVIRRRAIRYGKIETTPSGLREKQARKKRKKIKKLRKIEPPISNIEISNKTGFKVRYVEHVAGILIASGEVDPLNPNTHRYRANVLLRRRAAELDHSTPHSEIAAQLKIPEYTVENFLKTERKAGHEGKRERGRRLQRERLLELIREFQKTNQGSVSIWVFMKSGKIQGDYKTWVARYEELAKEQELPPLSRKK